MQHALKPLLIAIVNDLPGFPKAEQERILVESGLAQERFYEIGIYTFKDAFKACRSGEMVAMAKGARALGDDHDSILAGLKLFKDEGVVLVDPANPDMRSDVDGPWMVRTALGNIHGEGRIGPRARAMAQKAARAKSEKVRAARMGDEQAEVIWKRLGMTIKAKLKRMHGWTRPSAFKAFGPSGGNGGRPKKNPNKSVRT